MRVSGTERLAWNQSADATEIAAMQFTALVDGRRAAVAGAACQATANAGVFACSSGLPAMTPGLHSLQLVAVSQGIESLPSAPPLPVFVAAGAAAAAALAPSAGGSRTGFNARESTADGIELRIETLAEGLNAPADIALAPDGAIFVAERGGRIRLYADGRLSDQPAATTADMAADGGELLAIAVDPTYDATRRVYVAHTAAAPSGSDRALDFRVTRLTESGGTLRKAVVILGAIPAVSARPSAALRFGPDAKLYAAFDDGGSRHAASDMASYNGKVLRLNPDGTTPPDQPVASPVFVSDVARPRSLTWTRDGQIVWVGQATDDAAERLSPFAIATGSPRRTEPRAAYRLPTSFAIGGAATYSSSAVAEFRGNLFVGLQTPGGLLRVRFDSVSPFDAVGTERLLENTVGAVRAVAVGSDGALYLATDTALLRVTPTAKAGAAMPTQRRIGR